MSYVSDNLIKDEKVIYSVKTTVYIFAGAIIAFLVSLFVLSITGI